MDNFGQNSWLNSVQNFDQNSRQNSDQSLNNNSGKILAKFWQVPWVTFRPEFYYYKIYLLVRIQEKMLVRILGYTDKLSTALVEIETLYDHYQTLF